MNFYVAVCVEKLVISPSLMRDSVRKDVPIFMPPPLGAGDIMFSSCPSIRPPEARNTLFSPVDGFVGPSDQPWPFCGMSVRPSARKDFCAFAGKRLEGMAWYFAERIRLRSRSVDFFWFWLYFKLCETGFIWGFRTFPGERMEGMAWNVCMLMYRDPLQNWLEYGHGLSIFLLLSPLWLSERVKSGVSRHLYENAYRVWLKILHADVSWPHSELIRLQSWSVDFSDFGAILT